MKMRHPFVSLIISLQFWFRVFMAFLVPYLFFSAVLQYTSRSINELTEAEPKIEVAIVGQSFLPPDLFKKMQVVAKLKLVPNKEALERLIRLDSIQVGLVFYAGFNNKDSSPKPVDYYIKTRQQNPAYSLIDILDTYEDQLIVANLKGLSLDENVLNPIVINKTNSYSYFEQISQRVEQIKGSVASTINLFIVLMSLWLLRFLVLRIQPSKQGSFSAHLLSLMAASILCMMVVFVGFFQGIHIEVEGMARSVVLSINNLLVWKTMHQVFWMWLPTFLFVLGLLGWLSSTTGQLKAHQRTFWAVILLHVVALFGLVPVDQISLMQQASPLMNTFVIGQMAFKGVLGDYQWWVALFFASFWAVFVNYAWYKSYQRLAK